MKVHDWFSMFKSGVPSVENAGCSGCPAVSRTDNGADQVKELVFGNRRITTFEVVNVLEISFGPHDSILKDYLNMHLITPYLCPANWVRSRAELSQCVLGPSRETWKHLLTYFSKLQYSVKGMENQWYCHYSSRITWCTCQLQTLYFTHYVIWWHDHLICCIMVKNTTMKGKVKCRRVLFDDTTYKGNYFCFWLSACLTNPELGLYSEVLHITEKHKLDFVTIFWT